MLVSMLIWISNACNQCSVGHNGLSSGRTNRTKGKRFIEPRTSKISRARLQQTPWG